MNQFHIKLASQTTLRRLRNLKAVQAMDPQLVRNLHQQVLKTLGTLAPRYANENPLTNPILALLILKAHRERKPEVPAEAQLTTLAPAQPPAPAEPARHQNPPPPTANLPAPAATMQPMAEHTDIAIVGAGAAGLTTAIFAAQAAQQADHPRRIRLLDRARVLGAKILVSGGGRCNVTHDHIAPDDFNGSRNIVRNVLASFNERATVDWFESLGVQLKREPTGKLFPTTDSAKTVLAALLRRCNQLGVEIQSGTKVTAIEHEPHAGPSPQAGSPEPTAQDPHPGPFVLHHEAGTLRADRLVLATGGRSLPKTGSDGLGYDLARSLGHSVTPTWPALVPLVLEDAFFHAAVSGISHEAEVSIHAAGKLLHRRQGSALWTHFGLSGPLIMDASRHYIAATTPGPAELRLSFLPGTSLEQCEQTLVAASRDSPRANLAAALPAALPQRLRDALIRHAGLEPGLSLSQLSREARRGLARALTELRVPVVRDRGWNHAEVTAGGVPLSEINYRTMESRQTPGLHLVGEILDVDGRIGGFNFQWAWATGYLAGRAVGA